MTVDLTSLKARVEVEIDKAVKDLRAFGQDMDNAAKKSEAAASEVATSGKKMAGSFSDAATSGAGFAVGLAGIASAQMALTSAFSSTIGVAAAFEQSLANTKAATGATAEQMAAMRKEALGIGADTSKSAAEAAAAMGELVKAGVSVTDAVGGVARTVVQLSEATGSNVSDMAALLSNALNTFQADASDAANYADLLAKSANASAISVGDLGLAMRAVGPVTKLAGLTMADTTTAIGILGNNALRGSDAGTSLKTMLLSLAAPTSKARAEMQELGISLYDANDKTLPFRDVLMQLQSALGGATDAQKAQALATIFGTDAVRAGTILLKEGVGGWDKFNASVAAAPSVAEQSAMRLQTLSGQVEVLRGTLETMGIELGSKALPALTALTAGFNAALSSGAFQTFTAGIGAIAQSAGALVSGFMALPAPIQAFAAAMGVAAVATAAFAASPVVATIIALTAAVTFGIGALKQWADDQLYAKTNMEGLKASIDPLVAQALPLYAARLKELAAAGAGTVEQAGFLRQEYEKLGLASDQMLPKMLALQNQFGGNADVARRNSTEFATLETRWLSNQAGMTALEQTAGKLGVGLERTSSGAAVLTGDLSKLGPGATVAAQGMDPIVEQLAKIYGDAKKTAQALKDLVSPPTGVESAMAVQLADIAAAQSGLALATKLSGGEKQFWIDKARALIASAGLEGDALTNAKRVLGDYQAGLITGKDAVAQFDKVLADSIDTKRKVIDAESKVREAAGATAAAEIENARSAKETLGQREQDIKEFADKGVGYLNDMRIRTAKNVEETNATLTTLAAGSLAGALQANVNDMIRPIQTTLPQSAAKAVAETNATLATVGQGVTVNTEPVGAAAAQGVGVGFNRWFGGVKAGIMASLQSLASVQMPQAIGAQSPSKLTADLVGRPLVEGIGVGWDAGWDGVRNSIVDDVGGIGQPMNAAVAAVTPSLSGLAALLSQTGSTAAADYARQINGIDLELLQLNRDLAIAQATTGNTSAIEKQIAFLNGWKNQLSSVRQEQALLDAALEASRTAVDGYSQAFANFGVNQSLIALTGDLGAKAMQALATGIKENTPAAGAAAFAAMQAVVDQAEKSGNPAWIAAANEAMRLYGVALTERTPEAVQAALTALADLRAQGTAASTLTGTTWGTAMAAATASAENLARMGQAGTALMAALDKAQTEGGAANIQALATLSVNMIAEIEKLPPEIRSVIGPGMRAALQAVIDEPGEESMARLKQILGTANSFLSLIPKEWEKLPAPVKAAITDIAAAVDRGTISMDTAKERIAAILQAIPKEFAKLPPAVQQELFNIVEMIRTGAIGIEAGAETISDTLKRAADDAKRYADETAATLANVKAEVSAYQEWFKRNGYAASPGMGGPGGGPGGGGGGGGGGSGHGGSVQDILRRASSGGVKDGRAVEEETGALADAIQHVKYDAYQSGASFYIDPLSGQRVDIDPAAPPGRPSFATGVTNFQGGLAYVHKDELLVNMPSGTSVIPAGMTPLQPIWKPGYEPQEPTKPTVAQPVKNEITINLDGRQIAGYVQQGLASDVRKVF